MEYSKEIQKIYGFDENSKYDQYFEEQYDELKELKENKFSRNLILNENNKMVRDILTEYDFVELDGYLNISKRWYYLVGIEELKRIVEELNKTINNFNEESFRRRQIEAIERRLKDKAVKYKNIQLKEDNLRPKKAEYVYLIKGENGRYKIGASNDPKQRLNQLKLSSSENHELVHTIKTIDKYELEAKLHNKFKDKSTHSEWFELSEDDVKYIVSL